MASIINNWVTSTISSAAQGFVDYGVETAGGIAGGVINGAGNVVEGFGNNVGNGKLQFPTNSLPKTRANIYSFCLKRHFELR